MKNLSFCGTLFAVSIAMIGCGKSPDNAVSADASESNISHTHESWWCTEHGVPESACAQCNEKIAKEFKAKGDWCTQHDRPESQCFICHPEFEAKFAALYEAKYGTKPPKRTE